MVWVLSAAGGVTQTLTGLAALDLDAAAALFEISGGFLLGGIADLDPVDDFSRASRFRHAGRRAFVLDYVRVSVPVGDSALNAHGESILADDRLRQTVANFGFDLYILRGARALRGRWSRRRFGRGLGLCR